MDHPATFDRGHGLFLRLSCRPQLFFIPTSMSNSTESTALGPEIAGFAVNAGLVALSAIFAGLSPVLVTSVSASARRPPPCTLFTGREYCFSKTVFLSSGKVKIGLFGLKNDNTLVFS